MDKNDDDVRWTTLYQNALPVSSLYLALRYWQSILVVVVTLAKLQMAYWPGTMWASKIVVYLTQLNYDCATENTHEMNENSVA